MSHYPEVIMSQLHSKFGRLWINGISIAEMATLADQTPDMNR